MRGRKITQEQKEQMIELALIDKTPREIVAAVGLAYSTVCTFLNKHKTSIELLRSKQVKRWWQFWR